jgi:hypothetical protein
MVADADASLGAKAIAEILPRAKLVFAALLRLVRFPSPLPYVCLPPGNYRVIQSNPTKPCVAFDARVTQRSVLVLAEGEYGLIHLFGVEHPQLHKQMKPKLFLCPLGSSIFEFVQHEGAEAILLQNVGTHDEVY